jgi:HEAT repeat protein
LYRVAHGLFSRQEYRPAADRYSEVRSRHPTSRYFCDAAYYEAFARYRLGTPTDLRTAYQVLDGMGSRCAGAANREMPELRARIDGALARQGDAGAADRLRQAASQGQNVCDREERNVKIEAMSALARMDAAAANPVLREVLALRDECSAPIRHQAIAMVARRDDPESVAVLGQVARTDPDRNNRLEAVRALGRLGNDAAYAAIDDFLRNSTDEQVRVEAASSLARSDHPRAQAAVRALIERTDVAERLRVSMISALATRPGVTVAYWRSLYARAESDELRRAVIFAIARIKGEEAAAAQQFLLEIARNPEVPYAARGAAVSRIRSTAPVGDLFTLLQTADSRSMRLSIVGGIAARNEPEATDRLIDIAKTSTDPEVRAAAIRSLSQGPRSQDPKVLAALREILGGGRQP